MDKIKHCFVIFSKNTNAKRLGIVGMIVYQHSMLFISSEYFSVTSGLHRKWLKIDDFILCLELFLSSSSAYRCLKLGVRLITIYTLSLSLSLSLSLFTYYNSLCIHNSHKFKPLLHVNYIR